MIYKIKNKVVTQVWRSRKTLAQLRSTFEGADLREGDAVVGQVENADGVLENPPKGQVQQDEETRITDEKLEAKRLWDTLANSPQKKLFKLLLKDYFK